MLFLGGFFVFFSMVGEVGMWNVPNSLVGTTSARGMGGDLNIEEKKDDFGQ